MGSRARWVWNAEDHVWTEIYSQVQRRWLHIDPSEGAWDQPLIYQDGWGKKQSYVIGFSVDGSKDVTRRYVRKPEMVKRRDRIDEPTLRKTMRFITHIRREPYSLDQRKELEQEDREEEKELDSYGEVRPNPTNPAVGPRISGAGAWTAARGEDGNKD